MKNLDVNFTEAAENDLVEIAEWYETSKPGLKDDFYAEVKQVVRLISKSPLIFRTINGNFKKALLDRFPYALYYKISIDQIYVVAIIHTSRSPSAWRKRLQ